MTALVSSKRESDGKFALRLESKRSVKRDVKRTAERWQRERRLVADNAEFLTSVGIDPNEAAFLFA